MNDKTAFVILVNTSGQRPGARLLIESIRSFAGPMRSLPIWLFTTISQAHAWNELKDHDVDVFPLVVPDLVKQNWFAGKVYACARAEEMAGTSLRSLIWMSSDCLVLQPPVQFELGSSCEAALRPVHIRNIGLLASEPLDDFWMRVYRAAGVDDVQLTVESFIDAHCLRAYYNTHAFAINPSKGLMRRWYEIFETLVLDQDFQTGACRDDLHQIFLHQAVFSTLIAASLDPERVRMLPPAYNYPYNLQGQVPANRRAAALNDLVCIAYEERSLHPRDLEDIRVDEPLRSWLDSKLG